MVLLKFHCRVQQIPSQCDSACARGCSGTGPDKNCDACGSNFLRNATTLECIGLQGLQSTKQHRLLVVTVTQ